MSYILNEKFGFTSHDMSFIEACYQRLFIGCFQKSGSFFQKKFFSQNIDKDYRDRY
jgi:hypothetical protein